MRSYLCALTLTMLLPQVWPQPQYRQPQVIIIQPRWSYPAPQYAPGDSPADWYHMGADPIVPRGPRARTFRSWDDEDDGLE